MVLSLQPVRGGWTCNRVRDRYSGQEGAQHRLQLKTELLPRSAATTAGQQAGAATALAPSSTAAPSGTRRQLLGSATAASLALLASGGGAVVSGGWAAAKPAVALELAPLGQVERVGGDKLVGLSAEKVADILARNLREGQYFITGDLTPEIFADDCRFKDPTNETLGLSRYKKALGLLFDASYSAVTLEGIRVTSPTTIEAEWKLGGYLRFPWHPRIEPFIGHTVYHLNDQGLIALQDQTWSISGTTALVETFTPTPGVSDDIKSSMLS